MPDVSTPDATLFALAAVYIREIVAHLSRELLRVSVCLPGSGLMARQMNSSDWLYLELAI
jgi:hypothetical protein